MAPTVRPKKSAKGPARPAPKSRPSGHHPKPAPRPSKPSAPARPSAAAKTAPAPETALPPPPPNGSQRRHVLSLSFLRDGDEFLARLETDSGQITEMKNRSLDQLLTLVAGELEDLLE